SNDGTAVSHRPVRLQRSLHPGPADHAEAGGPKWPLPRDRRVPWLDSKGAACFITIVAPTKETLSQILAPLVSSSRQPTTVAQGDSALISNWGPTAHRAGFPDSASFRFGRLGPTAHRSGLRLGVPLLLTPELPPAPRCRCKTTSAGNRQ